MWHNPTTPLGASHPWQCFFTAEEVATLIFFITITIKVIKPEDCLKHENYRK